MLKFNNNNKVKLFIIYLFFIFFIFFQISYTLTRNQIFEEQVKIIELFRRSWLDLVGLNVGPTTLHKTFPIFNFFCLESNF